MDRIVADNDTLLEKEHRRLYLTSEQSDRIKALRAAIIDGHMLGLGVKIGEPVEHFDRSGVARYYIVGGIVIVVQLFGNIPTEDRTKTGQSEVVWQHTAAVVGVDHTGRVQEVGRGSLQLFGYDRIRDAINHYPNLDYDSSVVLKVLKILDKM